MNIDNIPEAVKVLQDCADKSMISKANLAYAYFVQGDYKKAKSILSGMVRKKMGVDYKTRFMHLAINHPKLTKEYRIVEDCNLFNIVTWNAALISIQLNKEDSSTVYSFLKKVRKQEHEYIHKRVMSWIKFFEQNISKSIEISKEILQDINKENDIYKLITKDIEIFESENNQLPLAY